MKEYSFSKTDYENWNLVVVIILTLHTTDEKEKGLTDYRLWFTGERLNLDEKEEEVDDIDAPVMGGELANALTGTTMTQLRLKNNELERELRSWRSKGKSTDDDQEIIVLQRQLADAVRSKERSEKVIYLKYNWYVWYTWCVIVCLIYVI